MEIKGFYTEILIGKTPFTKEGCENCEVVKDAVRDFIMESTVEDKEYLGATVNTSCENPIEQVIVLDFEITRKNGSFINSQTGTVSCYQVNELGEEIYVSESKQKLNN